MNVEDFSAQLACERQSPGHELFEGLEGVVLSKTETIQRPNRVIEHNPLIGVVSIELDDDEPVTFESFRDVLNQATRKSIDVGFVLVQKGELKALFLQSSWDQLGGKDPYSGKIIEQEYITAIDQDVLRDYFYKMNLESDT